MTDCPDGLMRDLLPLYARGVLEEEDAARVAGHLATCAVCRAEVALLARVSAALSLGVPRIDVAAVASALPAPTLAGARALPLSAGRRPVWRAWQYAAAAGLVLAVGSTVIWRNASDDATVRLADSTKVVEGPVAESARTQATVTNGGISFGGGWSDLSLDDLKELLGQMDSVRALPSTDPESVTPVIIAMNEGGRTL